ncbi:MAG: hypothetical protein GF331_26290, partial [Chitinivibrionales bacterium]|nr:hypothetical protein [Chitinivibrionales bacterium]
CALFLDTPRLEYLLQTVRQKWPGPLVVKCRLGENKPGWRDTLRERLHLFERCGVDGVVLHARFLDEKLKRIARWEEIEWAASITRLPVVGNGDIVSAADLHRCAQRCPSAAGFMIGRAAVAQPWLFRHIADTTPRESIDYLDVWQRLYRYTCEDFDPHKSLGRIKELTAYFARNFMFGHDLFRATRSADSLEQVYERACAFLARRPQTVRTPSFSGI